MTPESFPRDGQTVTVLRITGTKEVREEPIPFDVRADRGRARCSRAPRSSTGRAARGCAGSRTPCAPSTGSSRSPAGSRTEVVREPRAQLVRVGTKPLPTSVHGRGPSELAGRSRPASPAGGPNAVDPSGTYGGLYQFDTQTWHAPRRHRAATGRVGGGADVPGEEAVRAAGGESVAALRGTVARLGRRGPEVP